MSRGSYTKGENERSTERDRYPYLLLLLHTLLHQTPILTATLTLTILVTIWQHHLPILVAEREPGVQYFNTVLLKGKSHSLNPISLYTPLKVTTLNLFRNV